MFGSPTSSIDWSGAARKTLFLALLAREFGLAGTTCPEKVEGLAFGSDLANGRRLLIVAIDNDFIAEQPIVLHAFAVYREDLAGFSWYTEQAAKAPGRN